MSSAVAGLLTSCACLRTPFVGVWNGRNILSGVQPSAFSGWCLFNSANRLLTFSQRDTSPSGRDSSKYMPMRNKFGGAYRMPSTLIASARMFLNSVGSSCVMSAMPTKFTNTLYVPWCMPDLASTSENPFS